jgi:hypothetical protein
MKNEEAVLSRSTCNRFGVESPGFAKIMEVYLSVPLQVWPKIQKSSIDFVTINLFLKLISLFQKVLARAGQVLKHLLCMPKVLPCWFLIQTPPHH